MGSGRGGRGISLVIVVQCSKGQFILLHIVFGQRMLSKQCRS